MTSQTIEWSNSRELEPFENNLDLRAAQRLAEFLNAFGRLFRATVPAVAMVIATVWAIGQPNLVVYLQVLSTSLGIVFIAFALSSDSGRATVLFLLSALALFALGFFSVAAAELLVVAAALVAVWTGFALFDLF